MSQSLYTFTRTDFSPPVNMMTQMQLKNVKLKVYSFKGLNLWKLKLMETINLLIAECIAIK